MNAAPTDDVAVAAPAAPAPPAKPLEYDKSANLISRRQMNLFLLLIAVNTFLFATFICLPMVFPTLKQEWANYQKDRADKKQAAKDNADKQAKLDACLNYTAPPDRLVYTEVPAEGETLLASSARAARLSETPSYEQSVTVTMANAVTDSGWRPAVLLGRPAELIEWKKKAPFRTGSAAEPALLFLHELRTPSGKQRLVYVELIVTTNLISLRPANERSNQFRSDDGDFEIVTNRSFMATVIDPAKPETELRTTLAIDDPPAARFRFRIGESPQPDRKPVSPLRAAQPWRVFAAQHDPADPTHMTISYEIAGEPATIDGRLTDGDRLMLTPRVGQLGIWKSSSTYTWDLTPTSPTK